VTSIDVEALGKRYVLGSPKSATPWWPLGRSPEHRASAKRRRREVWALRDVSFSLSPGTILGVVGRNGAGKTTLLKILARITPPSEGRVHGRGRVIPLLQIGGGLHPFLTGRENVFLSAAMYGIPKREVERRFDAIVDFAGVGVFIDAPLRTYSSGMSLRLAFSIAVNLEPQILLADEVLAVGDAEFQERCLESVRVAARSGTTVLFVSHDMRAVAKLCNRALWLDGGRIAGLGDVAEVTTAYDGSWHAIEPSGPSDSAEHVALQNKGSHVGALGEILAVALVGADGHEIGFASPGQRVGVRIVFRADRAPVAALCAVTLHADEVCAFRSVQPAATTIGATGVHVAEASIPPGLLAARTYSVRVAVRLAGDEKQRSRLVVDRALQLRVSDPSSDPPRRRQPGVLNPQLEWSLRRQGDARKA
jgi:ABC-type polysaccharide/polyol phosphate transport system ATPase subunit